MIPNFIIENMAQIVSGGLFLSGFSMYSYFKLKGKLNKFKVQYCDVTPVIRQYKRLQKTLNNGVSTHKNDKFFN